MAGKVYREQPLLAAYAETRMEPAGLQEGVASDKRAAGEETEHARPGQIGNNPQMHSE